MMGNKRHDFHINSICGLHCNVKKCYLLLKIVVTLKPIPEYAVAASVVLLSRSNKLILSVFSSSFGQIQSDVMASVS